MIQTRAFSDLIGQDSVKNRLGVYLGAYNKTGTLPFINLNAAAGCGKTEFCRVFRENLKRPDGTRPPMLEVNAATIANPRSFFTTVFPVWKVNNAFLFLDEAHELHPKLQEIFLTPLNTEKGRIKTVAFEDVPYEFDFTRMSLALGTTDHQKLCQPLRDRLTSISFESYSPDELFKIFKKNLDNSLFLKKEAEAEIVSRFRGNPRDVIKVCRDLLDYSNATGKTEISLPFWLAFCNAMGILPHGLNYSELQVLRAIGKSGECSLTAITAITGFSRAVVQRDYEPYLTRKELMDIDGKRRLTAEGIKFYRTIK